MLPLIRQPCLVIQSRENHVVSPDNALRIVGEIASDDVNLAWRRGVIAQAKCLKRAVRQRAPPPSSTEQVPPRPDERVEDRDDIGRVHERQQIPRPDEAQPDHDHGGDQDDPNQPARHPDGFGR